MTVKRIYVEKKKGFDVEAQGIFKDIKNSLGISGISGLRLINRYDIEGITDVEYESSKNTVFAEAPVDIVFDEDICIENSSRFFAIEFLPGQYDQRADSAAQCIQILTKGDRPEVRNARVYLLDGNISDEEFTIIKNYLINPVECQEASFDKYNTLSMKLDMPEDVKILDGFINFDEGKLTEFINDMGFAMSFEDLQFCQKYFRDQEKRNPSVTEIRLVDTYWSDHCRHTTFLTEISNINIENGKYKELLSNVYESYLSSRKYVYGEKLRDVCLMDLAIIGMKELRKSGYLNDLDVSDEINACSIVVEADVNGQKQDWLVMFKNETHNHPTEIEPFGGAATCLGGAIRDPLSGRSYVYQAMRVTGSGDPRKKIEETISGKLPQKKITTGAATGYSSYGNQIGLATGQVAEVYHEGYVTKRMEIGAVIGAVPKKDVVREAPEDGDIIILLGGRTGRDGCGGATGSSKEHTEESLASCGAEVQKGNPPTERKIQRLFRKPEVSRMIKKCNDFGAGGVSVAIGELADGLIINLDAVPKKYEGLDGTELAISESQERMAVVVDKENVEAFIKFSSDENLEATVVAEVTADPRLKMIWREKIIVDISRDFLNTNGVKQTSNAVITMPEEKDNFFDSVSNSIDLKDLKDEWIKNLQKLNICSQKGLAERFDSTIGAGSVLMPYGGKYQVSPAEGMAAKLPILEGDTTTGTLMSYGYNPELSKWSPFHGAVFAIVESLAKIVAMGGDYRNVRLTFQEYFEKLGKDPIKWGKPLSALLGAYHTQLRLKIPAIGGKDSMSGTFKDMNVPPTLVSFAVNVVNVNNVVSSEFKQINSKVVLVKLGRDENELPDFNELEKNYTSVQNLMSEGKVLSASSVKTGGIAESISKMCFGNGIGFEFEKNFDNNELFVPYYGSIILELNMDEDVENVSNFEVIGQTIEAGQIIIKDIELDLNLLLDKWSEPLEKVFPTKVDGIGKLDDFKYLSNKTMKSSLSLARPRVFIPVFPGTNCEYDTRKAFENAGAKVDVFVVKNLSSKDIEHSIRMMVNYIDNAQIVMLPGGFSGGDEPDGSGKFIATAFKNPYMKEAISRLLNNRDGLMLGICNGFQALIKLGLVPYGEIRDIDENSPTLTFNNIGRHVSCMVNTKISSNLSPWFNNVHVGDIHTVAVSHGEGRFYANDDVIENLSKNGQIATQYVDLSGKATNDIAFNPNGSVYAIEGITSPDGRVLGKMGHSERIGSNVAKNVPGEKDQMIFKSGVNYYK